MKKLCLTHRLREGEAPLSREAGTRIDAAARREPRPPVRPSPIEPAHSLTREHPSRVRLFGLGALAFMLICAPEPVFAQRFATGGAYNSPAGKSPTAELLRDVGIDQHLDAQLPLDIVLRDESGGEVQLGDYFTDRPVVLALVQYKCPMLCTQVLNGFLKSSQAIPLQVGRDYQFVAISFDPREGDELAAEKKRNFVRVYRRPNAATGFHFLTADEAAVDRITKTVGFRYQYVARTDQFAHASGIMIATPKGRLARYLYGIEYSPHDLRLGLIEGSENRIGTPVDQVLLLCYHYDPLTGKYGLAISGVLKTAGVLTVIVLGCFLVVMYRKERSRPKLVRADIVKNATSIMSEQGVPLVAALATSVLPLSGQLPF